MLRIIGFTESIGVRPCVKCRKFQRLEAAGEKCLRRIRLFKGAKHCRILQEQSETEVREDLPRHKFGVERMIEGTANT